MRIFGFAGRRASDNDDSDAAPDAPAAAGAGRSDLLDEICSFLLGNALAVTARNLVTAHEIFSGTNFALARKVLARQLAGEPIDQPWLDEASGHGEDDPKPELDQFLSRCESSLGRFSDIARSAGEATAGYTTALEQTTLQIEAMSFAADDVAALAIMNRAMLDRTRALENDMKESRAEAERLKRSLAAARRDADIDHLTGLPNRRAFETVYEREYRTARAAVDHLAVAFCDIDHFKRVNDTHGHETGDRVIQAVAELLQAVAGDDDHCHVSRHGGEEFVLLFRGMTADDALTRIDRARAAMADRDLVNRDTGEPIGQVTFSAGVADVFAHADPRAALKAADEALYRAKQSGRNQVVRA